MPLLLIPLLYFPAFGYHWQNREAPVDGRIELHEGRQWPDNKRIKDTSSVIEEQAEKPA
ncbi:MAG: hypothetical protein LBV45_00170 [Xanthomonadaceae bacterium]|jgi:hypothetical protein|nr:hypothetical protein [Xanthomonadaceae bacterium]